MTKAQTETETAVEETRPSTKRVITATVLSTAVIVVLSAGANIVASQIGSRIQESLTKPKTETKKTDNE